MSTELVFLIEEAPEGGFTARALSQAIFTEGDTPEQVEENVRDAVRCHFDEEDLPKVIRHSEISKTEVIDRLFR